MKRWPISAKRLGANPNHWKLGAYHHALIYHPMTDAMKPGERANYDVGDLPRAGDAYTVDATGETDNQRSGGSFKIIVDTEDWDDSVGLNNPGQSGDVRDAHYRDLYPFMGGGPLLSDFLFAAQGGVRDREDSGSAASLSLIQNLRGRLGEEGSLTIDLALSPCFSLSMTSTI